MRDLLNGAIERRFVRVRGLTEARELADELNGCRADLVVGRRRIEVEERANVATHRATLRENAEDA